MRDLLVIVPSRGRPERLKVMIRASLSLAEADTDIAVAYDDDDEATALLHRERPGGGRTVWHSGPRDTLSGWANAVASARCCGGNHRAYASLGDDHVPRTQGWDRLLIEALDKFGGEGIAYGDDLHQGEALPTAPVISAGIVEALGWVYEPSLAHMYADNVWMDLGQQAGCLAYVPEVVIEHLHPDAGKAASDAVYAESAARTGADREAYYRWRRERMAADVAKVRAVLGRGA